MRGSNWSSHSALSSPPHSTSPLPLSAPARHLTLNAHCHHCHLHSVAPASMVYFTTQQQRGMPESSHFNGQKYSDENQRGFFSFPSKAGDGKSVPRRNQVLPVLEGLGWDEESCWAVITDSYSHLTVRVHMILSVRFIFIFIFQFVCVC